MGIMLGPVPKYPSKGPRLSGPLHLLLEAHATSGRPQCRGFGNNTIVMEIWGLSWLFYPNTLVTCLLKYSGRHTTKIKFSLLKTKTEIYENMKINNEISILISLFYRPIPNDIIKSKKKTCAIFLI